MEAVPGRYALDVDEELRRAERAGDWRDHAARLRHAGRAHAARRAVEARAQGGDAEARALLDDWYPLDRPTLVLFDALDPPADLEEHRVGRFSGLPWLLLLGDPDPRCLERLTSQRPVPAGLGGWKSDVVPWAAVEELWTLPFLQRLLAAFQAFGPVVLERTRLSPREAVEFARALWVLREGESKPWTRSPRQSAAWALGVFADPEREVVDLISQALTDANWLVRFEGSLARAALERRPHTDDAWGGWSGRPGWLPWRCPAVLRDPLTGCLERGILRPPPEIRPPHPDAPRPSGWVLLDVDMLKRVNDVQGCTRGDETLVAVAEGLQQIAGDRVVRWGGDEFLVCLEEATELYAFAERLRAAAGKATGGLVTASASVVAGRELEGVLRRLEEALHQAKLAGRDRTVIWSEALER